MKNILTFLFFMFTLNLYSQDDSLYQRLGIYGGLNLNSHTGDFNKLKGIPNCCPNFTSGSGLGFNLGLLYEIPVMDKALLGFRLGVSQLSGELKSIEKLDSGVIVLGEVTDGEFTHYMDGKFMNINIAGIFSYNIFSDLFINAGIRTGLNITKDFEQVEKITKPTNFGTFLDSDGNDSHSRTRNEFSGEIPDANSFTAFGLVGLSYELQMNNDRTLLLVPEITYNLSFLEFVKETDWQVNTLSVGLALKYVVKPKPPVEYEYKHEHRIDTIRVESDIIAENTVTIGKAKIEKFEDKIENTIIVTEILERTDTLFTHKQYQLSGDITAVGIDANGRELPNPKLVIEEFVFNRMDPLLNYVFFDDNSSVIPARFKKLSRTDVTKFEIDSLYELTTPEIYYNLINIVGQRLRKYPQANITLVGCNSDIGEERGNTQLSRERAENVKNYLVNIWNIEPNRIKVNALNLPEKASTPKDDPDKIEENRRVEIYSDDYRVIEPVFISNIQRTTNLPQIRFDKTVNSDAGVKEWAISTYQKTEPKFFSFKKNGTGNPALQTNWTLENEQTIIPKYPIPLYYQLHLTDTKGTKYSTPEKNVLVEVITVIEKRSEKMDDYEIERFSLILFDFDQSTISEQNSNIINFIKNRIEPNSLIEIIGYTDRTGDETHNLRLSERRARSTQTALGRKDVEVSGVGSQQLLYDNNLPEGRFYCRTVVVNVKTKVE